MPVGYINTDPYSNSALQSTYDMAAQNQAISTSNESIFSAMNGVGSEVVSSVFNPMAWIMAPLQLQDPVTNNYIKTSSNLAGYEWTRPELFNGKEFFGQKIKGVKSIKTDAGKALEKAQKALEAAQKTKNKSKINAAQKALETVKKTKGIQTPLDQLKNFNFREVISRGVSYERDAYRSFAKTYSGLNQVKNLTEIINTYGVKLKKGADVKSLFTALDQGEDVLAAAGKLVKNSKDAQKLVDMTNSVKNLGGKNYLASKNPLDMLGNGYRKLIGKNKFLRKIPVISVVMNSIGQFPDLMSSAQYGAEEFGKQAIRSTALVATNVVGMEVGSAIGAKLGAIIGTAICPVFGTGIGTIIGSIAGGTLFSSVGTKLVNWITDKTLGKQKSKEDQELAEQEAQRQMLAQQQALRAQNPYRQAA